jgi:hypothetical protein
MEAAACALQRMYRGCVGAAQCLMDVVGTEIEPDSEPAAATPADSGRDGRDGASASPRNAPQGGIVPQPRVLCAKYVITGMVDEGLHMDSLLRECIYAFKGALPALSCVRTALLDGAAFLPRKVPGGFITSSCTV